jgi:hypothetical protein
LARLLKPGGTLAIAQAGLTQEIDSGLPEHLRVWWEPGNGCLHSAPWWRRHWERSGVMSVELADTMPDGHERWLDWLKVVAPDNAVELQAVQSDGGRYLGYIRAIARRLPHARLEEPITSVPMPYTKAPLLRSPA